MRKIISLIILLISLSTFSTRCANLSQASYKGNFDQVQTLIEKGHDVNKIDRWGWTPLMWATLYGNLNIARHLLDNGADPNIQSLKEYRSIRKGATALIIASYYGNIAIIRELRKNGADATIEDSSGNTAITYAEQYHGEHLAKLLKGEYD